MSLIQAPKAVVMVRPWRFHSNPETADDNAFQKTNSNHDIDTIANQARSEFDNVVQTLGINGVTVHDFDDYGEKETPDSVFPNNWFSTHVGGRVAIYPMYSKNRRRERRIDIIEMLKSKYRVQDVVDYSGLEWDDCFLEGTGAMVLDNVNRIAYTAKSNRSDEVILERFCTQFGYEPMAFDTADENGVPTYHTNVIMCVASEYVIICLAMIKDDKRRQQVKNRILDTGKEIIDISFDQVNNFAGNALELTGKDSNGKNQSILAMSQCAYEAFSDEQKAQIEQYSKIVPMAIPTIELAGGSIRCMLAGVHLSAR